MSKALRTNKKGIEKGTALNKYGVPVSRKKDIPCRCRKCGARKTLSKYPEEYQFGEKKCHSFTCDGLMRVDKYRLQAGYHLDKYEKDSGKKCTCNGHPRMHPLGRINSDLDYVCIYASDADKDKHGELMEKRSKESNDKEEVYERIDISGIDDSWVDTGEDIFA